VRCILFSLFIGLLQATASAVDPSTTNRSDASSSVLRPLKEVTGFLQQADGIYATNPAVYFQRMDVALDDLYHHSTNRTAQAAEIVNMRRDFFLKTMRKPCPSDRVQALACFDAKRWLAWHNMGNPDLPQDKRCILALAYFIGEMRSRTLSREDDKKVGFVNFSISGTSNYFASAEGQAEIRRLEAECKVNCEIRNLQNFFLIYEPYFSGKLQKMVSAYLAAKLDDQSFREELVGAAHLTPDEQKKFGFR